MVRGDPFICATVPATKLLPATLIVTSDVPPAATVSGVKVMEPGTGLFTDRFTALLVSLPLETDTESVEALAVNAAGTIAVSWEALTSVAGTAVVPIFNVVPEVNPEPLTVSVTEPDPTGTEVGEMELMEGAVAGGVVCSD